MNQKYSAAFIEQAMVKVLTRGSRTIQSVADELNINHHTLKNWMKKKTKSQGAVSEIKEKRPQDWTAAEQLRALQETYALSDEERNAWCREHGLFSHHLTSWKAAFCADDKNAQSDRDTRALKDENTQLKRDLLRKEKALVEAAALLVLQKKFRALWEDEEK